MKRFIEMNEVEHGEALTRVERAVADALPPRTPFVVIVLGGPDGIHFTTNATLNGMADTLRQCAAEFDAMEDAAAAGVILN